MRAQNRKGVVVHFFVRVSVWQGTVFQYCISFYLFGMDAPMTDPATDESRIAVPQDPLHALHAWQRYYNMEPRSDSRLTTLWLSGTLPWSVDTVARELMVTDFLFKHTSYGELSESFLRHVASRLKNEHRLSWKAVWTIVRFYGPIALKLLALKRAKVRLPERLP